MIVKVVMTSVNTLVIISQSVSGRLDRPRVVVPSKTCGHVRFSRHHWRWAQCHPRSAAPTFCRVIHAGASTPAWCPVSHLHECPQPGIVQSRLVIIVTWIIAGNIFVLIYLRCKSFHLMSVVDFQLAYIHCVPKKTFFYCVTLRTINQLESEFHTK